MVFNSLHFAAFFIVVTSLYFAIPHKFRWLLLLISSCYFYMTFVPVYILILAFTIVVDYWAGIFIEGSEGGRRKAFLVLSIVANVGVLAIFKYYNFLNDNLSLVLKGIGYRSLPPHLYILLPIGLSFHTFQAMSYTIEVYRGKQKPERHFGIYALYVMFYPQLVAGPIERPQNLLHQFYEKHQFDYSRVTDGLRLMAWGLFKKIVIADRLAVVVDNVYNDPNRHHGLSFIIATLFFSFQIYCDFSGYSDMAIGMARVMGFKLMKNFDQPYHSRSVGEFWTRWHISLSAWFKDYLYIPLGGNRVSIPRWYFNIFVVFLVSGLWHGANWTFILWGGLHACYLLIASATKKVRNKAAKASGLCNYPSLNNALQVMFTFAAVSFAWIFFRAPTIHIAFHIVKSMFADTPQDIYALTHHLQSKLNLGLIGQELTIAILSILLLEAVHLIAGKRSINQLIKSQPALVRWLIYYGFLFVLVVFSEPISKQFIYFQF
ncbi:MAG: MBOAT family protein [Bacteroidetes bacterium]|nr:MBOAT family protein [Bacteroidota bacterium]